MTPGQPTAIARYDELEAHLRTIIDAPPRPLVRRGKVVYGDGGELVPDTRPAAEARKLLVGVQRDRALFTGQPAPPPPAA